MRDLRDRARPIGIGRTICPGLFFISSDSRNRMDYWSKMGLNIGEYWKAHAMFLKMSCAKVQFSEDEILQSSSYLRDKPFNR